jgi:hypothetical protein
MTMPDQQSTLREQLGQMESLQKKMKARLDAIDSKQPTVPPNELIAMCNRMLILSRVFLEMATKANRIAERILRHAGKG